MHHLAFVEILIGNSVYVVTWIEHGRDSSGWFATTSSHKAFLHHSCTDTCPRCRWHQLLGHFSEKHSVTGGDCFFAEELQGDAYPLR